jgi:hypothetical protein
MRQIPAFSKKASTGPTITSGLGKNNKQREGFTPNVMVSKKVEPKPIKNMAARHGNKSQIGGLTPGTKGAPGSAGRKVHAAKPVPAFSKKKV